MADYKLTSDPAMVIRTAGNAWIPEGHPWWADYQAWLAVGNTPDPADAPVVPPISVSPWQFRKALNQLGIRQAVEDYVTASTDQEVKDGWQFATEFVRTDAFVAAAGTALGKTDTDMDALFQLAASL